MISVSVYILCYLVIVHVFVNMQCHGFEEEDIPVMIFCEWSDLEVLIIIINFTSLGTGGRTQEAKPV